MQFEWDLTKAASNFAKHGVSFEEAVLLWSGRMVEFDADVSAEPRRVVLGQVDGEVLAVVYDAVSSRGGLFRHGLPADRNGGGIKKADSKAHAHRRPTAVREAAQRYEAASDMVFTTLDDVLAKPMTRRGLASRRPSEKQISRAAADDEDAPLLTARQLAGGRTVAPEGKVAVSLRIDRAVVDAYKATGKGWQTRMNEALAASIPSATGDTGETIRALERTVQSAALFIQKLKLDAERPATSNKEVATRAPSGTTSATARGRKRPK